MSLQTFDQAEARYGKIVNGNWANEGDWLSNFQVPEDIANQWRNGCLNSYPPTTHIYCNKDMQPGLAAALKNLVDRGLLHQLKTYDGCENIRCVRGRTNLSWHAYGLAVDLNAADEQMGTAGGLSPEFVACWTDAGFFWGGDYQGRKDPMHFQWGIG